MKNPNYSIPAIICSLAIVLLFPYNAASQDAEFIFNEMRAMQLMRWEGVQNYTITLSIRDAAGMETSIYHERMEEDGQVMFREVPRPLYEREMHMAAGFPPPEDMAKGLAYGYEMLGPVLAQNGYPTSGMMVEGAGFLRAAATASDSMGDGKEEARDALADWEQFKTRARVVGTDEVVATSGSNPTMREAYHLVADDLFDVELEQPKDGGKFTLERIDYWVDSEQMVPLKLEMKGQMERDNEITPLTISKLDLDYHQDGPLYESHTKIYQLSGIMEAMSKKEKKEMEKAMAELERAKEELANMTTEQKAMMEKFGMSGKMEQLEKMLEGDKIESIVDVTSIAINEGPPTPYGMGTANSETVLTYAGHIEGEGGIRAELAITGTLNSMELSVGVIGNGPFPDATGNVNIVDGSGYVVRGGSKVAIDGASGTITVLNQTDTHIAGTYDASLKYDGGVITISGNFDSGAPVGTGPDGLTQGPRGSPLPAVFSGLD